MINNEYLHCGERAISPGPTPAACAPKPCCKAAQGHVSLQDAALSLPPRGREEEPLQVTGNKDGCQWSVISGQWGGDGRKTGTRREEVNNCYGFPYRMLR